MQTGSAAAVFKHLEVVHTAFAARRAEDALAALLDDDLAFVGVRLLFTRVVATLFFWGVALVTQQCPR